MLSTKTIGFSLLVFALTSLTIQAQVLDSSVKVSNKRFEHPLKIKNVILPAALITYGVVGLDNPNLKRWNTGFRSEVLEHIHNNYHTDDYLQYVPGLAVYILDDAGLRAKHSFWDRTAILGGSFCFQLITVLTLKYTTNVMRPDSSDRNSFPSGHTTLAFSGAEFLWQEYKDHSVWIGVSGYVVAGTIGFSRIINNKHWITDVFAGAGIGILSTKISYYAFERIKLRSQRRSQTVAFIFPYVNHNSQGFTLSMRF